MKHLIEGRTLQWVDILIEANAEPYFTCPGFHDKDVKWGVCVENSHKCKHFNGIATKVDDPYSKCYEKAYIKCSLNAEIETKKASRERLAEKAMVIKCQKAGSALSAFLNR